MDGLLSSISPRELYAQLGTASATLVIDARSADEIAASERLLPYASLQQPRTLQLGPHDRAGSYPCRVRFNARRERRALVAALRRLGWHAYELAGGFAAWESQALPTRRKLPSQPLGGSRANGQRSTASLAPG